jgi:STE24 endopeptidase
MHRWLSMADTVIGFVLLIVLLATGWTGKLRDWSYLGAHQYYFFAVFLYVLMFSIIAKALSAPFDVFGFRLEHQYHLSNQKVRSWLWDECKGWLVSLVLGTIMVELVYGIIRIAPQRWWIIAWAVFIGLFLLMAQLAPVVLMPIFYKFEPLNNDALRERLTKLGERAGTRVRGVYEWKLSEKSNKANAALAGIGSTRRIILSDTLLQHYSDDEIEAILAHELGHHVHKHILKSILTQVGITFFAFWLINFVLRFVIAKNWFPVLDPRLYDFANLPLIVLVATVLGFLLMPALNAISRHHERQADRYAWENTPAIEPFITSMQKLADQNLAERQPNKVIEWLFHSHPSIGKRVSAAEAWASKRQVEQTA